MFTVYVTQIGSRTVLNVVDRGQIRTWPCSVLFFFDPQFANRREDSHTMQPSHPPSRYPLSIVKYGQLATPLEVSRVWRSAACH
ncbi:hypothetical protein K474DRAFT_1406459 [Panus rudis PR-1116 ss-1]|nr:hypothetical protein K474DRAFT_1406459 [Panus rudis PR-1116 ss-1]